MAEVPTSTKPNIIIAVKINTIRMTGMWSRMIPTMISTVNIYIGRLEFDIGFKKGGLKLYNIQIYRSKIVIIGGLY